MAISNRKNTIARDWSSLNELNLSFRLQTAEPDILKNGKNFI